MYFGAGSSKLRHAQKDLRARWDATEDGWRDQVRQDFEERQVRPLDAQVTLTLRAMEGLNDLLAKIHRECS